MIPRPMKYAIIMIVTLALIPPVLIVRARVMTSDQPRIHFIQDMDNQHRFKAQQVNPLFADGRAMRPPVPGTVARGGLNEDDHLQRGLVGDGWAETFPGQLTVDETFLRRGRERFDIYCAVCHGAAGYGDGAVHQRAMLLLNTPDRSNGTSWVPPKSVHEEAIREQPPGQVFNTISNGVRNMAGYGGQISVEDRWAIVAYVRALQRSQDARPSDVDDPEALPEYEIQIEAEES